MNRIKGISLFLAALVALSASSAHAVTELNGNTDGGAFFRIVVPDAWNGGLVIWNHGFSLSPIGPVSDLGPLSGLQLDEGYAVAASSYQQYGWALFKTKNDIVHELMRRFVFHEWRGATGVSGFRTMP